jgi:hypothetical protein
MNLSRPDTRAPGTEVKLVIFKAIQRNARAIVLITGLLLVVDIFLHWRAAPVHTQWLDTDGASSAVNGWGGIVILLLAGFFLVELVLGRRGRAVAAGLASAAAALTVLEFFVGSATVPKVDGIAVVTTEQTLWPAYAGLALAALIVFACLNRVFAKPEARFPLPPALPGLLVKRSAEFGHGAW